MKHLAVVCVVLFLALGTAQRTDRPATELVTTAVTVMAESSAAPTTKPHTTLAPTTKPHTTSAPTTKPHTTAAPTTAPPPSLWSVTDKTGKKCLLAEFDLTFSGTYEFANKSKGNFVFPLPPNSAVDRDNSHCGSPTEPAVIVLTFDNDKFALEFEMDSNTNMFELTSAKASLVHSPAHFPDSGDAGKTVKYGGDVTEGTFKAEIGKCFRCFSMDKLSFKANDFACTFRRLRVQPFEVEGGKFGEDSPCAADEAPSHWFVKDSHGAYCLLADFSVTFTGTYETTKKATKKFSFAMPQNAVIDGAQSKCGDLGKSNAVLALTFDNGDSFIQEFSADAKKKTFELHSAIAMLTHDAAHFPDSADVGKKITYGGNTTKPEFGTGLGSYYKCSSKETVDVGSKNNFALVYTDLKVQPFNVTKKYGKMNQCALDTPTVRPAEPPMGKWNVSNTKGICMLMDFGADFIITYTLANKKNSTVGYYLPLDAQKGKSTCDDKTATLVLDFEPGQTKPVKPWEMVMKFTMDSNNNYAMTFFSMLYYLDKEHFPGMNESLSGTEVLRSNKTARFNTVSGSYYFCNTDQDVYVDSVVTTLHNLTIQPFTQSVKGGGFGSPADCAADNQVSNIVPIAVGCALAGLVIIVLIAYLIGRSRTNRAGYQSV